MTALYRFHTDLQEFVVAGHMEKVGSHMLLRVWATTDQAFAVKQMESRHKPVLLECILGDEVVMPGRTELVLARADGNRVELSCILRV